MTEEIAAKRRSQWQPLLPVPEDAPAAKLRHHLRGDPMRIFTYRDGEGRLLGYVCRFARSSGGIAELTLTWCVNLEDKSRAWRWIQFPAKRPIFGWDRIAQAEGKVLLLVHEEWAAEELRQTVEAHVREKRPGVADFANYEPIAWPGGRTKIGEVDWSPLRGKLVFIWMPHSAQRFKVAKGDPQAGELIPIERQPWRVTARRLQETLREFGAIVPCIVEAETTEELPDEWDAIAALNTPDWDTKRLSEWVEARLGSSADIRAANTLASTPAGASGTGVPWMRTLLRKTDGSNALLPELHNLRLLLSHHDLWKGVIYLDEFSHTVMKAKAPPYQGGAPGEWSDMDDSMTADWMASQCGILKLRTSLVAEAVGTVAKLNARNPLQDYLRGLKWDKKPRIGSWLKDYVNAGPFSEDMIEAEAERLSRYLGIVGRLWLMGAVKRALQPGCKFDYMLILEGQQGLGKSSVAAIIGGDWAMDSPFSLSDKEGMENIRGKWVVEIPELDSFNKAESSAAKSFFARQQDRFRMPYAKRSADFKRACVFLGTVNEDEYLRDPTGNRRYWPAHCDPKGYDAEKLRAVRDQLLAEAVHRVLKGEQYWPTRDEEKAIRQQQRLRETPDSWIGSIAGWLRTWRENRQESLDHSGMAIPITRELILRKCLHVEVGRQDERGMIVRIGRAMHKLGYIKIEDKTLDERFRYEKRQSGYEDDE